MSEEKSYRDSVYLPETSFPMRSEHATREPEIRSFWALNSTTRSQVLGMDHEQKFTIHDGPPYANGNIHMGHAMNKIIKDMIARSRRQQSKAVSLIPGWDCHGLPIEWKVDELYKAEGLEGLDLEALSEHDINGRQIKNTIKLAIKLARAQGTAVDNDLVNMVISRTNNFMSEDVAG